MIRHRGNYCFAIPISIVAETYEIKRNLAAATDFILIGGQRGRNDETGWGDVLCIPPGQADGDPAARPALPGHSHTKQARHICNWLFKLPFYLSIYLYGVVKI